MKKYVTLLVLMVLLSSSIVVAEDTPTEKSCDGFFGSIKCFLFGRGDALVGGAGEEPDVVKEVPTGLVVIPSVGYKVDRFGRVFDTNNEIVPKGSSIQVRARAADDFYETVAKAKKNWEQLSAEEKKESEGKSPTEIKEEKSTLEEGVTNFKDALEQRRADAAQSAAIAASVEYENNELINGNNDAISAWNEDLKQAQEDLANADTEEKRGEAQKDINDAKELIENAEEENKILEDETKDAKKEAADDEEYADSIEHKALFTDGMEKSLAGRIFLGDSDYQRAFGGAVRTFARLGEYRAFSNVLMPEVTQEWSEASNDAFLVSWSDVDGFAAREQCGIDDAMRSETPGQGYAFVRTTSGTYQFVGSIQAEKSSKVTEMLCEINPDDDADEDELFICPKDLICKDDQFCYADEDDEEPVKARFYKITWGVTAPQDEAFTPFIDENGKAVRFNLRLQGEKNTWVFKRGGMLGPTVLSLENGASDGGTIVKFLKEDYSKVCIIFSPAESVIDHVGDPVNEICADFITSAKGVVEYGDAASAPVTSTSEEVSMNI